VTLSERLERAKTQRLIAEGKLPGEAALKPEQQHPSGERSFESFDPVQIEVPAAGLTTVAPSPAVDLTGDGGEECPNCKRPGKVDMVDLVGHTVHLSCPSCGTLWRARHTVKPG